MNKNGIENRPIISGNFVNQPSFKLFKFKANKKTLIKSQEIEDRGFFIGLDNKLIDKNKLEYVVKHLLKNIKFIKLKKINQIQPWINHEEANYVKKVITKTYLTENFETKKFEKNIKNKLKIKNCIAVSNWTNGLLMCLKVLDVKPGDEIIVPNLTFIATATPAIWLGAKIVLCDVDENNFCLNLNDLKKLINKKTKCIIPVHLYGHCCDLDKLKKITANKKIFIIEDAAQAIGAKYKDKFLGGITDFGGFSFYGNKIITTGEGGAITFKDKKYYRKFFALKNHGREIKGIFKHQSIGYNFMFTEMQAAVGNIQLKKLNKILAKKKKSLIFIKNICLK